MKTLILAALLPLSCSALVIDGGAPSADLSSGVWDTGSVVGGPYVVQGNPTASPRATGGSTSTVTVFDRVYSRRVGAATVTDFVWDWQVRDVTATRGSSNAAVVTPDASDPTRWTFVGNGAANITVTVNGRTFTRAVTASTAAGSTTDTLTGYAAGSVRAHAANEIDTRLAGKTPATAKPIFSTYSPATATYIRSTACWAYGYDLTPISPGNSAYGALRAGVLVAPDTTIHARHYPVSVGTVLHFVTSDNVVVTRTVSAATSLSPVAPYYPDIQVCRLSSDVPETISFARVLPANWATKIPSMPSATAPRDPLMWVPCLALDQEEKATVMEWAYHGPHSTGGAIPLGSVRASFYEDKIGGDSGNPFFLMIDGKLVLLGCYTNGPLGAASGAIQLNAPAINATMTAQGSPYQLTEADWSAFNSY